MPPRPSWRSDAVVAEALPDQRIGRQGQASRLMRDVAPQGWRGGCS